MNLKEIFDDEPTRWGLRGDPYLWLELKKKIDSKQDFITAHDFLDFLKASVKDMIGQELIEGQYPYVQTFDHGGMSGGRVSCEFWLHTAIPLLVSRFNSLKS